MARNRDTYRRNAIVPEKRPMFSATMMRRGGFILPTPSHLQMLQSADSDDNRFLDENGMPLHDDESEKSVISDSTFVQMRLEDQLTNDKLQELQGIFEEADEDGGGGLDMDEFRNAMRKAMGAHLTDKELDQLFMKVDTNCDGTVDWDEYLSYMLLEYREKDQMLMESQKPFPKDIRKVRNMSRYQRYSDAMIRVTFAPSVKKENNTLYRPLDDGNGKYITVSKDGIINFWTLDLKHIRNFRVERQRPTKYHQHLKGGVWVTDLVLMSNLNMIVISTSASDVIFYATLRNKISAVRCIVDMEICLTCMDHWVNPSNPSHSILVMGDARGNVYGLTFKFCDRVCFFNPATGSKQKITVSMADVLAGKHCCVTGVLLHGVHTDFVLKVKYVPELQTVISCCRDRSTALFSGDLRQSKKTYYRVRKGIFDFAYCRKNNVIVTGGKDTIVRVWNPYVSSKPVILLHGHKSAVLHVIVNEKEEHVVSISEDKDINVFDMSTQVCVQTIRFQLFQLGARPISAAYFNEDRQSLIVGTNQLAFLEHEEEDVINDQITSHTSPSNVIIYNHLFDQLISGSTDSLVCVWDINTGKKLMQFYAHKKMDLGQEVTEEITAMKLDPTKRRLATAARDGMVRIWNFNNGALLRELEVFDNREISSIVWERGRIITAGWNRHLTVYVDSSQTDNDAVTHFKCRHYEDILALAFVPPATVVSASYDGDILCWSMDTGRLMTRFNATTGDKTISEHKRNATSAPKTFADNKEKGQPAINVDGNAEEEIIAYPIGFKPLSRRMANRGSIAPFLLGASHSGRRLSMGPHRTTLLPRTSQLIQPIVAENSRMEAVAEKPQRESVGERSRRESVAGGPRRESIGERPRRESVVQPAEKSQELAPNESKTKPSVLGTMLEEEECTSTEAANLTSKRAFVRKKSGIKIGGADESVRVQVPPRSISLKKATVPKISAEERSRCMQALARLVRKRQSLRKSWDKGVTLAKNAKESSVDKLLILESRSSERDTACLVATGAGGWVRFWSVHPDSGLLGEFCGVHNAADAILTMTTDDRNRFLITGDTSGYIKVWFIELYCTDTSTVLTSETWLPRRPDGIPSHMESEFEPFLGVTDKAKRKLCPNTGIHPCRGRESRLCGAPPMVNSFRGHLQPITCIEFLDNREYIASCSGDCSIRLWTLNGEFMGIFGKDIPWERSTHKEPSIASVVSSSSTLKSSTVSVRASKFTQRFSNMKQPDVLRKLPSDVRKVASSTTMRVLYGGVRPHWKLAKNIVLIWVPMLRSTRRQMNFSDLASAEDNQQIVPDKSSFSRYLKEEKNANILGKSYKPIRKHKPLPKLHDIRCFQNQVNKFYVYIIINYSFSVFRLLVKLFSILALL